MEELAVLKVYPFPLTLKASIMTAADDIHKYCFHCFSEKIRLDDSAGSSASPLLGRGFT